MKERMFLLLLFFWLMSSLPGVGWDNAQKDFTSEVIPMDSEERVNTIPLSPTIPALPVVVREIPTVLVEHSGSDPSKKYKTSLYTSPSRLSYYVYQRIGTGQATTDVSIKKSLFILFQNFRI